MIRHLLQIGLYLLLGFILDYILTWYYQFIIRRRAALASLFGMLVTALNLWVIAEVVVSKNFILIISFIVGQGAGTFLAVRLKREE